MALLAVALLATAQTADAAAPTLAQITAHLRTASQYDDPAAKVPTAQRKAIDAAIKKAAGRKRIVRVAVLSATPPDGPRDTAATRLRVRLKLHGTVIVALPTGVLVASLNVSGARLAQVRSAVAGKTGAAGARLAVAALLAPPAPPASTTPTTTTTTTTATTPAKSGGSSGIATWIYLVIAAVVLLVIVTLVALRARTRDVRRRGGGSLIVGARALLQGRLDELGERLAETAVGVSEREDLSLSEHHRSAADTVSDVRASIGKLDGPPAFRNAHARLDEAEWHLGVVQAHIDGLGEPTRPESGHPARCFFNAEHGLASVEIELELPGVRTVSVGICAADAVRLARGEEPEVGAVQVGRRTLPWAAAPTWYGGWGWGPDDLPVLRYHGSPVFSSRAQLDAFSDSVASPRTITVRPAPSEPFQTPSDLEVEAPVAAFIPDPEDEELVDESDLDAEGDELDDEDAPFDEDAAESDDDPQGPPEA
ncbi:MAG TPA: hypothetical protein VGF46_13205 [Gaiellales bacterium]|jgi:hypothetical protein